MTLDAPATSLSTAIVQHLQHNRRMTLKQIGKLIGGSESFISRVATGQRNFTLPHLVALEEKLGESLPVLLLQARPAANLSPEQQEAFDSALELLKGLAGARRGIRPAAAPKKRASKLSRVG